jgi:hypothetical protein
LAIVGILLTLSKTKLKSIEKESKVVFT